MLHKHIYVATDFSTFPAGRYRTDGNFSGEEFRENYLIPALSIPGCHTHVHLDGTMGYSSSWLQETFGKLAKIFQIEDLKQRLTIYSEQDSSLVNECWLYLKENKCMKSPKQWAQRLSQLMPKEEFAEFADFTEERYDSEFGQKLQRLIKKLSK